MPSSTVAYRKKLEIRGSSTQALDLGEGIAKVKQMAGVSADRSYKNGKKRKAYNQTVELVMHLGIDPRQADQAVRGALSFPKGIGKARTVIAFCDGATAAEAKAAGAIEAGGDELVEKITKGWLDFDVAVAHPSMMGKVGKLGRVLGPHGKMPTPKSGTVTQDVVTAVREFTAGRVEYRNDAGGNVHLPVGKVAFPVEDLKENIEAAVKHMARVKPAAAKGQYFKRICISATNTPAVTVNVAT
ncbi:MAG: 50S ribosomal protein L1 [Phycisphaerales bacterium]|nr:MAG: 50S ribosomal protein L1 [Phycisphaerales bacterium]